ncbi:hypothetical protein WICMUC_000448 [Wickerhamomyces mucosus]|uniref:Extradiol ring-cleavage dioxygenase class III enzyme subunit B domain-containing protein n=1 Tax=Wickerhamomyces mucosus TaxID=1378264 RepID=A0A9P8TIP3_9ASCO|nr:hypothetical protein WICMUC_000448 [Wickerhamomyces mucosus]
MTLPTYFIAHGGVSVLNTNNKTLDGYRAQLKQIGEEILALNPKGIIATSGHFESPHESKVRVNFKEDTDVLYDYFFKHDNPALYQFKFKHFGSKKIASEIKEVLQSHYLEVEEVEFDTDHGIWVPNKLLFSQDELTIPLVSVSTYKPTTFEQQVKLGESLAQLRNEGYVIINYGMPVHNVYFAARDNPKRILDALQNDGYHLDEQITNQNFAEDFTSELETIISLESNDERKNAVLSLENDTKTNLKQAHPTLEHFNPYLVFIGSGLDSDKGGFYDRTLIADGMSYSNFKLSSK